ncbi:hypothetical protein AAE02nite_15380 [Adhaeribacter aerolatus]|uniref:DUF1232 domain-containing protein n=1 Tax=Adhaeribacter aerolatus TaxID=670289 RepID=A0A512AVY4_9BACT|nr:YkvA family protein [Adhaeribacter aerolatus]GEO03874.1 hypothetical protein AAE02nite_15380 [Adhaeribacter aerolatus]
MTQLNKSKTFEKIKAWAKQLKRELNALQIAYTKNLVPWYIKILILITVAYALSPVDLIPDFIPILGLLDDLIIVPLLIYLIIKFIPAEIMEHCRKLADSQIITKKKNWIAGGFIIVIWLSIAIWIVLVWTK